MSELEPDHLRAMYNAPAELENEASVRLGLNPVFEKAFEVQFRFMGVEVERSKLHDYWKDNSDIANELTAEAKKARLIGEQVTIKGEEISIPKVIMNLVDDTTTVSPLSEEGRQSKMYEATMTPVAYSNVFKGFTLKFKKTADDTQSVYEPYLAYMLNAGRYVSADSAIDIFATGDIRTTSIDFKCDNAIDEKEILLQTLYDLAPHHLSMVDWMSELLDTSEYSNNTLHDIASSAQSIVDAGSDLQTKQVIEDTIADLVKRNLSELTTYSLKTYIYLHANGDIDNGEKKLKLSNKNLFSFAKRISDVVFMDEHPRMPRQATLNSNGRSLHIILADLDAMQYTYIPFSTLQEFTKK